MPTDQGWLRLLDGVIAATADGRLAWRTSALSDPMTRNYLAHMAGIGKSSVYTSETASAWYEIASLNPGGSAPYEFSARSSAVKGGDLGSVRSTTLVTDTHGLELNRRLAHLYDLVKGIAVDEDKIVDDLLRDLGEG